MPWLEPAALLKGEGELLPPPWARPGLLKLDLDNLGLFFSAFGTVDQREAAGQALDRAILGAVTHLEELYPLFAGGDDLLLLCPPERALSVAAGPADGISRLGWQAASHGIRNASISASAAVFIVFFI